MNSLQRNLWILVTVSALAIILQDTFNRPNLAARAQTYADFPEAPAQMQSKKLVFSYSHDHSCSWTANKRRKVHTSHVKSFPKIDTFVAGDTLPEARNFASVSAAISHPAHTKEKSLEGVVYTLDLVDEWMKMDTMLSTGCGKRMLVVYGIK